MVFPTHKEHSHLSSLGISKKCLTPTVTISPDSSAVRGVVLKKVYSNHETQCVQNIFLVNSGTPLLSKDTSEMHVDTLYV